MVAASLSPHVRSATSHLRPKARLDVGDPEHDEAGSVDECVPRPWFTGALSFTVWPVIGSPSSQRRQANLRTVDRRRFEVSSSSPTCRKQVCKIDLALVVDESSTPACPDPDWALCIT
ncbi:hypothetical protein OPT61_g10600 [Boeremia exigua]|uniref:Uncharacterized protein n=1 Tax=Boeremia exigua TaxID=749465 RepID=A0ACC2HNT6_9PLEO|nr:hypothetical protein OPT61_g10600 [Boeremia exigua]